MTFNETHQKVLAIGDEWDNEIIKYAYDPENPQVVIGWDAEEADTKLRQYYTTHPFRLAELLSKYNAVGLREVSLQQLLGHHYGESSLLYPEGSDIPLLIDRDPEEGKWEYFVVGGVYAGSFVVDNEANPEFYTRPDFKPGSSVLEKFFGLELTDNGILSAINIDQTLRYFPTALLSYDVLLLNGEWTERNNEDMDEVLLWQEIIRKVLIETPSHTSFATVDCVTYD